MADTRKDRRAPVSLKVRFKSATVDEFIEHYSKDVSRGGIFIKSSQPMSIGTLLKFQFQLKDESALIRGVGRVVWTRAEEDAGEDQPAGMGIKFIKMDNDSRAMVERIIDAHAPEHGTYERGRKTATNAEASSSAPPPPEAKEESFFPDLPPAELPLPEDRTAVRQAAQFLAAALTEGGTDEASAREAQEKAAEAQKRTEEIEAQRRQEAELKKRKEPVPAEPLPSMIIDPSLDARAGSDAERPTDVALQPVRDSLPVEQARAKLGADDDDSDEPDTEPPPPPTSTHTTTTTSFPHQPVSRARPNYLPIAIIAGVLAIALGVALRGGPKETPVEELTEQPEQAEQALPEAPATIAPAPEPHLVEEPPPPVDEDNGAAVQAAAQPAEPAPSGPSVRVEVVTAPRGAQVFVGTEPRGTSPVAFDLPAGAPVVVSARAPGYAEVRAELTPKAKVEPLRLKLKPLPYIVEAETTPPGAAINVAGHRGTTPVELKLDDTPKGELSVNAKLPGYEIARMRLSPSAFSESDGAMRAKLTLTLEQSAARETPAEAPRTPKSSGSKSKKPVEAGDATTPSAAGVEAPTTGETAPEKPSSPEVAPKPADSTAKPEAPKSEATAAPKAEPPKPEAAKPEAPKPEAPKPSGETPKEQLPDNPFGD